MYTIPDNFEIEKLIGTTVTQISFSINSVFISFDGISSINIQGSFSLQLSDKIFEYAEIYPVKNDMGLLALLGKQVLSLELNDKRDALKLNLEGVIVLHLIGHEMYESFSVKIQDEEIIV
jgi:hypothetical protein